MRNPPNEALKLPLPLSSPRTCSGVHQSAFSTAGWFAEPWMPERARHDGGDLGQRVEAQRDCEVVPMRVVALDQVHFPVAVPLLDSLLGRDRRFHRVGHFVPDQADDAVMAGKAFEGAFAVLENSADEVRGHAYVQRAVIAVAEDVDAGLSVPHALETAAPWTPEQVRGDEVFRHAGLVPASILRQIQGIAA